jgi:hypothetical protein
MILFTKNYLKVVTVAAEWRLSVIIVFGKSGMRQFSQDLEGKICCQNRRSLMKKAMIEVKITFDFSFQGQEVVH